MNVLSALTLRTSEDLHDEQFIAVMKTCPQLTPWFTLRHDYKRNDLTAFAYDEGLAQRAERVLQ